MTANLVLRADVMHATMEASYPMFQTKTCLLLPIEHDIPLSWYLLYAFEISTWQA
ncbi:uncharacterized protein LOC105212334 [Zeugodacus cucurbitae]|uniref:uncharacterized protein LOC105212334 n=1 Tax=Zeugodacus cucurbitae TaxID=28588 RepID=UPI0023D90154|nr:uncharacterized protein LOC105212334 [Zeugodacus cucurbitae]